MTNYYGCVWSVKEGNTLTTMDCITRNPPSKKNTMGDYLVCVYEFETLEEANKWWRDRNE